MAGCMGARQGAGTVTRDSKANAHTFQQVSQSTFQPVKRRTRYNTLTVYEQKPREIDRRHSEETKNAHPCLGVLQTDKTLVRSTVPLGTARAINIAVPASSGVFRTHALRKPQTNKTQVVNIRLMRMRVQEIGCFLDK